MDTADTVLFLRVQTLIARVTSKEIADIRPEMRIDDLVMDSIELFRLIMAFEEEFQKRSDYRELMRIETVQDIVDYIGQS